MAVIHGMRSVGCKDRSIDQNVSIILEKYPIHVISVALILLSLLFNGAYFF